MSLVPVARPLLLCHDVLPGPTRGTQHAIAICNALRPASGFPYCRPELCVLVQLADAHGDHPIAVQIVEAATQFEVFRTADHVLHFRDRFMEVRALFRIRNGVFPRPGVYWAELYCRGEFLTDQVLHLLEGE